MKKSYLHRGGEEPLLGLTIPEHFRRIAERFPEREAIVSIPQGRRLTYGKLADRIDKLARSFLHFRRNLIPTRKAWLRMKQVHT